MKGEFRVIGVRRETGEDFDAIIEAATAANAKVKAELAGVIVTEVVVVGERLSRSEDTDQRTDRQRVSDAAASSSTRAAAGTIGPELLMQTQTRGADHEGARVSSRDENGSSGFAGESGEAVRGYVAAPHEMAQPCGLGGWLVLVHLQIWLGGLFGLVGLFVLMDLFDSPDWDAVRAEHGDADVALLYWFGALISGLCFQVGIAITFYLKSRVFPGLYTVSWIAAILLVVIGDVINHNVLEMAPHVGQTIGFIAAGCVWIWYVSVSKRVRNTFSDRRPSNA